MPQPKPKKMGRPKLPKGYAKGVLYRSVSMRATSSESKCGEGEPENRVRMDSRFGRYCVGDLGEK